MDHRFAFFGALLAGIGVGLGAFGAHALQSRVAAELLPVWETAVRYHMYHALALLAVGLAAPHLGSPALTTAAGWLFVGGIMLFSGSLYLLTVTGTRMLGMVTPMGGLALLAGWACLAAALLRRI
jgi:uncharacterized membrane protein YgdD (TMEM256/DUF423 family)